MDPEIDKEGLTRRNRFFNEGIRMHRVFVDRHLLAGAIKSTVFVIAILSRSGRIGNHVISEVPLAIMGSRITRFLKHPWKHRSLGIEPIRHTSLSIAGHPCEVTVDVVTGGKVPRQDRGATRRTNPAGDGKAVEVGALLGKSINIRCPNVRMSMASEVTPAPVVGKDENNIGTLASTNETDTEDENE